MVRNFFKRQGHRRMRADALQEEGRWMAEKVRFSLGFRLKAEKPAGRGLLTKRNGQSYSMTRIKETANDTLVYCNRI